MQFWGLMRRIAFLGFPVALLRGWVLGGRLVSFSCGFRIYRLGTVVGDTVDAPMSVLVDLCVAWVPSWRRFWCYD